MSCFASGKSLIGVSRTIFAASCPNAECLAMFMKQNFHLRPPENKQGPLRELNVNVPQKRPWAPQNSGGVNHGDSVTTSADQYWFLPEPSTISGPFCGDKKLGSHLPLWWAVVLNEAKLGENLPGNPPCPYLFRVQRVLVDPNVALHFPRQGVVLLIRSLDLQSSLSVSVFKAQRVFVVKFKHCYVPREDKLLEKSHCVYNAIADRRVLTMAGYPTFPSK
nr:hypothetical protein Iba_chr02aCG21200 [Ipomoea batatas]